jgi:hypothetical protein
MSDRVGRGHIVLQHKKTLAHPTRFEGVTFAFGEQTPTNPAVRRRRKLKGQYLEEPPRIS